MDDFTWRSWTSQDGLTLWARDYAGIAGRARLPVICIHGLTRNARDFETVAPRLAARGRRVLAVDVRGRGRSDRSPDPRAYALPVYVQDVIAMAGALGIARAVFIGTSMGGLITMGLAATVPEMIGAAVLNDIGPELAPVGLARIVASLSSPPSATSWEDAASALQRANGAIFPGYAADDWMAFAKRVFKEQGGGLRPDYDPAIAPGVIEAADAPAADLWPFFEALALVHPVLLVRGAISDLLSQATSNEMRRRAPEMAFVEAPGIGHPPMLTEPEVEPALHRFLDQVD